MNSEVRVTVGICTRNAETTMREALESVDYQDFPHSMMELIIVDGCSTDRTMDIVDDCVRKMDLSTRIFRENKGLGVARQMVVDKAMGRYIVWVDSDMTLSEDFVRKEVEFMDQNPGVAIAKGRYRLAHGANLLSTLEIYSRAVDKMADYSIETTRDKSLGTSGCIYRVDAVRQVGGFDPNIRGYGEDWDVEYRTRTAGWSICTIQTDYRDYERLGITWKELWQRYWRRGYDLVYFFQKYKGAIQLYKMLPPAAFMSGLFKSLALYKLTHRKFVFLLPLQNTLKMIPWWSGYIRRSVTLQRSRVNHKSLGI